MEPENTRICSKSSCKASLPPISEYKWKQCVKHREAARQGMNKKRQRCDSPPLSTDPMAPLGSIQPSSSGGPTASSNKHPGKENKPSDVRNHKRLKQSDVVQYETGEALLTALREMAKNPSPRNYPPEYTVPSALAAKIREDFPHVTSQQVYRAWVTFSEILWKRSEAQMESASGLLREMPEEASILQVETVMGVSALGWGLKEIAHTLEGKIVEIAIDATYNTNAKDMELYGVLAEQDNSGIPIAYCLLTTASAITPGKHKRALKSFMKSLCDEYNVHPKFVHTDKDIAEIKSAQAVWVSSKHQLCWWHVRKAVKTRLQLSKLSTSAYNIQIAHSEFSFIDLTFISSQATSQKVQKTLKRPVPPLSTQSAPPNALPVKIRIPQGFNFDSIRSGTESSASESGEESTEEAVEDYIEGSTGQFCPEIYHDLIINMMERHYCAHPLIPGVCAPTSQGIRYWAVKEMYNLCVTHGLHECWGYLWENWYSPSSWKLWARAECEEIPILKTTMIYESHWRKIKHDYLSHFHKPRLDILVWILMKKYLPYYSEKLKLLQTYTGRIYRNLPAWRKAFKKEWRRCETATVSDEINPKYAPNVQRWVCTCPSFARSRFLICKHLVHMAKPVSPKFFHVVKRCRTTPFWQHPDLKLIAALEPDQPASGPSSSHMDSDGFAFDDSIEEEDDEELERTDEEYYQIRETLDEDFKESAALLRWLADAVESQVKFRDPNFFAEYKQHSSIALRYAGKLKDYEKQLNSRNSPNPHTWDSSTPMFFRTRTIETE
ncbi:hypothetical protein M422DRAFT_272397 [Sphaerobolus stellatus SS14]|uniref:SWIM-type domain-containing protein n=1 Tax=Sphaerobolus stellatus (strain SS14) TaxID=990650 RepID=A0A0C9UM28_SPHS4|nr:hypothetical protein M422DRAFT_272397 [Sphaerobolus stellatus SS14]